MLAATLLCQWRSEALVRFFTDDSNAVAVGVGYLMIISLLQCVTSVVLLVREFRRKLGPMDAAH